MIIGAGTASFLAASGGGPYILTAGTHGNSDRLYRSERVAHAEIHVTGLFRHRYRIVRSKPAADMVAIHAACEAQGWAAA